MGYYGSVITVVPFGNMEQETFRPIEGYEGLYEVSNLARIKSLPKEWTCGRNGSQLKSKGETFLVINESRKDYDFVSLSDGKKVKCISVHRLVATYFVANPDNKPDVNHKDGNKRNNRHDNLEWCTKPENQIHAYKNGLQVSQKGIEHHRCKITESDMLEIKILKKKGDKSQMEIGDLYGLKQAQISRILSGKRWTRI